MRKQRKSRRSMTAVTWMLIAAFVVIWGGSMACATLGLAEQLYQRLCGISDDYAGYAARRLDFFYDPAWGRYGEQYERPDLVEYYMLYSIQRKNYSLSRSWMWDEGPQPRLLRAGSIPLDTAVLFYDGDGNFLHGSGEDFLYFNYATREEWDAGAEEQASHCGWIDIGEGKDAAYDPYARFHTMYSGTHSLYDIRVLRVTGVFEGTELKPAAMDFLTETMLYQALEQIEPTEHSFDESGGETISYEYLISDLDRAGLLEWQTQFDHLAEAERPEELVTVYALRPEMYAAEDKEIFYKDTAYPSLAALLAGEDIISRRSESGGFYGISSPSTSEFGLDRILYVSGREFWDTRDPEHPAADYYMVTAVVSYPLKTAMSMLRNIYLWTGLLAAALLLILRNAIQNRLVRPLSAVNAGMAEDWRYVYTPDNRPPMWREAEELYGHYQDELDRRRYDKNEITRLNAALGYAKKAEQNRRQMTSAIAHELKTPLAVVHSYAEGLKAHIAEDKRETYLDTILSETERMDGMVLDLLDLSRLEAGRVKLSRDEFSLCALVRAVFEKLAPLAEERNLAVTLALDGDCPVIADEARIGQAVENFASNALRYAPERSEVTVKAVSGRGKTAFSVENAVERPFTAEELSRVWDTFYQTDPARGGKGTGLGLAIAKNIVELHGGRCSAQNTNGGISFSFWIPG